MAEPYICALRLCDYLTYSSAVGFAEIAGVTYTAYKPQPYLHNYPLMYGFAGILHASLASKAVETFEIDYSGLSEIEKGMYVYPARPRSIVLKRMLLNIKGEGAVDVVQPRPKGMYPWHVAHLYFAPGSVFETVLLVRSSSVRIPTAIRVGVKRQGTFSVECRKAKIREYVAGSTDPVNLGDLHRRALRPHSYTVLLNTKTVRKEVPYSNVVVRAYFDKPAVAVLEAENGARFKVPIVE